MTVAVLIKKLKKCDPKATVVAEIAPGSGNYETLDGVCPGYLWDSHRLGLFEPGEEDIPRRTRKAVHLSIAER